MKICLLTLLQNLINLELLENLKKWFKFKFEVIYFYNVYGPKSDMQKEVCRQ